MDANSHEPDFGTTVAVNWWRSTWIIVFLHTHTSYAEFKNHDELLSKYDVNSKKALVDEAISALRFVAFRERHGRSNSKKCLDVPFPTISQVCKKFDLN